MLIKEINANEILHLVEDEVAKKHHIEKDELIDDYNMYYDEIQILMRSKVHEELKSLKFWAMKAWHSNSKVSLCIYEGISKSKASKLFPKCNVFWNEKKRRRMNEGFSPSEWVYHSLNYNSALYFKTKSAPIAYRVDEILWDI